MQPSEHRTWGDGSGRVLPLWGPVFRWGLAYPDPPSATNPLNDLVSLLSFCSFFLESQRVCLVWDLLVRKFHDLA